MERPKLLLSVVISVIMLQIVTALHTQVPTAKTVSPDKVLHSPSSSLTISGDLKDLKLKKSISQLVRALQDTGAPKPSPLRSELKHNSNQAVPTNVHSKDNRKLYFGQDESVVPAPITISSQPIKIGNANKTGPKKPRSMTSSVDADGVRTIEGVRVPDDEADKFYTWRNARVIKNFLVPNGQEPNPHKKRQVVITDPQAYLAAAAAAQQQGAATIIDTGSQSQNSRQTTYFQAQPQPHSVTANVAGVQGINPGQQHQQWQGNANNGAQEANYLYAQQGQMYMLQDGSLVQQYSPVQAAQSHQIHQQAQPVVSQLHSQTQFSQRKGESPSSSSSPQQPNSQKPFSQSVQNTQLQQDIAQAQAAVQAIQQLQQGAGAKTPGPSTVAQGTNVQPQTPPEARDALTSAASSTQYIVQTQPGSSVVYELPTSAQRHQQQVQQNAFSNRQDVVSQQSVQNSGFVIQPKTYVAGAGGQTFTIPVPVPANQVHQQQQYYQQSQAQPQHQRQEWGRPNSQNTHPQFQRAQKITKSSAAGFASRVMEALHSNKNAMERIDAATAVVPALASTGIFLGLSALAAGWYLSRGNREVGIVRRTGKPAAGSPHNRVRRNVALPTNNYPQEVDQATFFQSIIQQSLEKTQQQYEDQVEPVHQQQSQPGATYYRQEEPSQQDRYYSRPSSYQHSRRPQSRDDDAYARAPYPKPSSPYAQEKSGVTVGSSKNFAKVFIPAMILGLSVVSITALIFGWYITGANREIAFLEPASYSRKKRSLFSPKPLSEGWLYKTITALHRNPYDRMPNPVPKSILPHPFLDRETSKTSDLEFKISNAGITGVLAGGALIAIVAFGLANSFSEGNSRTLGRATNSAFTMPNALALKNARASRTLNTNHLTDVNPHNPGFLSRLLASIDASKLQDSQFWAEKSPCAKKLICEVIASDNDDTVRSWEKRLDTLARMLPDSYTKAIKDNFEDLATALKKRDCSHFLCSSKPSTVTVTSHGKILDPSVAANSR